MTWLLGGSKRDGIASQPRRSYAAVTVITRCLRRRCYYLNVISDAVAAFSPVIVPRTPSFLPDATSVQLPPTNCVDAVNVMVYSPIVNWSDGHDVPPTSAVTTPSPSACGCGVSLLTVMTVAATEPSDPMLPATPTLSPGFRSEQAPPTYRV